MKECYCAYCTSPMPLTAEVCPKCQKKKLTTALHPLDLAPGTVLKGRYVIGKSLGSGGFGTTYIARDKKHGVAVTIKEYLPAFACDGHRADGQILIKPGENNGERFATFRGYFKQESSNLLRLKDVSGIRQLTDHFDTLGTSFQVLEYLDGMPLSDALKKRGKPFSVHDASLYMQQMLDILSKVHQHGVLHRDISPDNIFLCADDRLKVIDFGSSCIIGNVPEESFAKEAYTAPEAIQHALQEPYTDIYSAGITMFFLLTGRKPTVLSGAFAEKLPEAFSTVAPVYLNAVAPNPLQRYQTAAEMRDALAVVSGVSVVPIGQNPVHGKKKGKKSLVFLLVVLLFGMAALIAMSVSSEDATAKSVLTERTDAVSTAIPNIDSQNQSNALMMQFATDAPTEAPKTNTNSLQMLFSTDVP